MTWGGPSFTHRSVEDSWLERFRRRVCDEAFFWDGHLTIAIPSKTRSLSAIPQVSSVRALVLPLRSVSAQINHAVRSHLPAEQLLCLSPIQAIITREYICIPGELKTGFISETGNGLRGPRRWYGVGRP